MFGLRVYAFCSFVLLTLSANAVGTPNFEIEVVPAITDDYILEDYKSTSSGQPPELRLVAAPDEYEPASFVVFADDEISDLKLVATALVDAEGAVLDGTSLDIRVVKRWLQRGFGTLADARRRFMTPELLVYDDKLVETRGNNNYLRLESGEYVNISKSANSRGFTTPTPDELPVRDASALQPLTIKQNSNRQFWVTLHVPANAKAGNYRADIQLYQGDQLLTAIPVFVEVLPFTLDEPLIGYSIYYRGVLDEAWPNGSISSEYKSKQQLLSDFHNLYAHGITNPAVYQKYATGLLEEVFKIRRQAGMSESRMLYVGATGTSGNDGVVSPTVPGMVTNVLGIAGRYGFDDVFFYARDEAKGELLLTQFVYWDVVHEAGGKIMAAGSQSDGRQAGNFDSTGGKEDLFVSLGMARYQEARRWHSKGRLIYSYQNPTGGWEVPETWRRNYGLLLWQNEYDGAMPYAWQHSYSNIWNDFDDYEYKDHNFTYPTVNGQIDTVH